MDFKTFNNIIVAFRLLVIFVLYIIAEYLNIEYLILDGPLMVFLLVSS